MGFTDKLVSSLTRWHRLLCWEEHSATCAADSAVNFVNKSHQTACTETYISMAENLD